MTNQIDKYVIGHIAEEYADISGVDERNGCYDYFEFNSEQLLAYSHAILAHVQEGQKASE